MKYYRIVCLKRTQFANMEDHEYLSDWYAHSKVIYWRDNYSGYTDDKDQAGLYSLKELDDVAGRFLDYFLEPAWV